MFNGQKSAWWITGPEKITWARFLCHWGMNFEWVWQLMVQRERWLVPCQMNQNYHKHELLVYSVDTIIIQTSLWSPMDNIGSECGPWTSFVRTRQWLLIAEGLGCEELEQPAREGSGVMWDLGTVRLGNPFTKLIRDLGKFSKSAVRSGANLHVGFPNLTLVMSTLPHT